VGHLHHYSAEEPSLVLAENFANNSLRTFVLKKVAVEENFNANLVVQSCNKSLLFNPCHTCVIM